MSRLTCYVCGLKIHESHITIIYLNKALLLLSVFQEDFLSCFAPRNL